jgi:hypothetical protein
MRLIHHAPLFPPASLDLPEALEDRDPEAFELDAAGFAWRGHRVHPDELARARRGRLHSTCSCSFFEPVEELEAMEMRSL